MAKKRARTIKVVQKAPTHSECHLAEQIYRWLMSTHTTPSGRMRTAALVTGLVAKAYRYEDKEVQELVSLAIVGAKAAGGN